MEKITVLVIAGHVGYDASDINEMVVRPMIGDLVQVKYKGKEVYPSGDKVLLRITAIVHGTVDGWPTLTVYLGKEKYNYRNEDEMDNEDEMV